MRSQVGTGGEEEDRLFDSESFFSFEPDFVRAYDNNSFHTPPFCYCFYSLCLSNTATRATSLYLALNFFLSTSTSSLVTVSLTVLVSVTGSFFTTTSSLTYGSLLTCTSSLVSGTLISVFD